ncbi:hypothetical protein OROMI_004165 [Orobanche minor]
MQMQKMEGISYGHRGFIFAQNNLPDDGKPFGNCNYRREGVSPLGRATESAHPDSGISYGHRRFVFAQKNLHDDGAPFGNYNLRRGFILMDSVYNNHGLFDVFIQNENNFLQLNNTIQVACEDIGTSTISGRKRKKKSKETDTSLSDKNRRFAYLKKKIQKLCKSGQISLQLPKMHPLLWDLYTNQSCPHAKHFRTRCRSYNNSFAFTSLGMTCDKDLCKKNKGVYTVRVQGTIAHYIDELVPNDGSAKCLQLYFYSANNEVGNRMATFDDLDEDVIRIIMDILTVNPYAVFLRNLRELPNIDNALIVLRADPNLDQRVYNLPLVDHIAAIWEEPFSIEDYNVRDIRVYTKCQESRSIHYYYGCYDPLQYPLLFPFGELGWHVGIKILDPSGSIGINRDRIYCPGQHQIQANFYTSGETFLNDEHQNMERNKKNTITYQPGNILATCFKICSDIKLVKYLYKYVCKGTDKIKYSVVRDPIGDSVDEIKDFQTARWLCATESLWRIYGFALNGIHPPVLQLHVHLEDKQPVWFPADSDLEYVHAYFLLRVGNGTEQFEYADYINLPSNILNVRDLGEHVIGATIACGEQKGKYVLIPKIPLQTKDNLKCPIPFKRYQFPIKLCFAITINKAQGQTLDRVGIYLPQPVFSHDGTRRIQVFGCNYYGNTRLESKSHSTHQITFKNCIYDWEKYQKLVLVDDLGNGVDAVIFGDEIEKYKDVLQEKKTYMITNALIKIADERYKTPFANTGNSWIITDQTTVSNVNVPSNVTTTLKQHFIDYEEYNSLVGTTTLISTIALIVDRKPPRMTNTSSGQNTIHEYVAIDKGLKPIIVTLWNNAVSEEMYSFLNSTDKHKLVALINFKVSSFHGISLTSNASSIELHDLEDPQYKKMKAWFESHEEEIKTLLQNPKRFELTVKVDLEDFAQKFIYMCCQNCHRKTTAPVDTIFHCTNCKADKVAKYRYMFKIRVKDPTGELDVTLFREHGMNIFNMKEDQFKAKYSSESTIDLENINGRLQSQTWKMTLQKKTFEMWNGTKTISYIVQEMDGIQCTEQKLEDISPIDTHTQKATEETIFH